jgi:hypothetical protein
MLTWQYGGAGGGGHCGGSSGATSPNRGERYTPLSETSGPPLKSTRGATVREVQPLGARDSKLVSRPLQEEIRAVASFCHQRAGGNMPEDFARCVCWRAACI